MNILNWLGLERKKTGRRRENRLISDIITRREEVYSLYFKDGMRQEEVAKRLGVSIKTIERDVSHLREEHKKINIFSFNKEHVGFKDLSKRQIKEIHRLAHSGKIYEDIAKIVGTTKGVIGYVINRKRSHKRYSSRKYIKEHREDILRRSHNKKTPDYYHEYCPACNKSSHLTINQWVELQKYVRTNRLRQMEFSLSSFLMKHNIVIPASSKGNKWGITPESVLRVIDAPDGIREFIPVTKNETLQRTLDEQPKGGFILSDDY